MGRAWRKPNMFLGVVAYIWFFLVPGCFLCMLGGEENHYRMARSECPNPKR